MSSFIDIVNGSRLQRIGLAVFIGIFILILVICCTYGVKQRQLYIQRKRENQVKITLVLRNCYGMIGLLRHNDVLGYGVSAVPLKTRTLKNLIRFNLRFS